MAIRVGIPTGAPEVRALSQRPKKFRRMIPKTRATTPEAMRRISGIMKNTGEQA
jgi:hypothetical protein